MKILIASKIHSDAIAQLEQHHEVVCAFNADEETLQSLIEDCNVLIFRSGVQISARVMAAARDLRLMLRAGSGVDNIDIDYVQAHNLNLIRIPGPGAKAVAELSFSMMLALARNMTIAHEKTRQGVWEKHKLTGYLLTGKTLGIVGAGNIGSRTGYLGAAWGMNVLGCVETPTPQKAEHLASLNIRLTDIDEVLREADFVSIHVPLQDATRNLIDAQTLAKMKPGAYLVNLARGGVVDELALREALVAGRLAGAGLDVHVKEGDGNISPLADLPNVILTPHIGAGTYDSQYEIGTIVVAEVAKLAAS